MIKPSITSQRGELFFISILYRTEINQVACLSLQMIIGFESHLPSLNLIWAPQKTKIPGNLAKWSSAAKANLRRKAKDIPGVWSS